MGDFVGYCWSVEKCKDGLWEDTGRWPVATTSPSQEELRLRFLEGFDWDYACYRELLMSLAIQSDAATASFET
jgi:hypothetical protein